MYYKREMNEFNMVKIQYNACREFERKKIINYLKEQGLKVGVQGGQGVCCYTNGGKLDRSYDLTNWKWINIYLENEKVFISLQAFDQDANSKNYHVLMDRIGLCRFDKNTKEKDKDYFNTMKVTSLELPLSEQDLKTLHQLIVNL